MPTSFPNTLSGFRFWPIEFDKKSRLVDPKQVELLSDGISATGVTDLLVMSHGWNNDEKEAMTLYRGLIRRVADVQDERFDGREVGVAGIFWPSKKFADSDVIPGGAASLEGDLPESALIKEIKNLRGFFDAEAEKEINKKLLALVPRLDSEPAAVREFGELAQRLLGTDWSPDKETADEFPKGLLKMPGEDLINELSAPRDEEFGSVGGAEGGIAAVPLGGDSGSADSEGGAAFLGSLFSGLRSGAKNALNLLTYFQMKKRAGEVGAGGLSPALLDLASANDDVRFHLTGHSFGGRLVTAAANGAGGGVFPAHSMTLLQAAFSHNGFAEDFENGSDGFFRKVVSSRRGLKGPVVITHTGRDLPNRWAYPMASRLHREKAAAFGGPDDVFGAIGSNGAQHTPEAVFEHLLDKSEEYEFKKGTVHNLESSKFVPGHGSVTGIQVAHALVAAMVAVDT